MNKNKLITACVLSGAILASFSVNAEEKTYLQGFSSKINQGFFNIGTGFIEIPKNIVNISHEQNIFVGLTWGTLRGVGHAVSRTLIGGAELLTSPIPTDDYITPPYVWERFSEDTRYFGLHYPGYWTHYGPLDHGK
ncbi:MAG: exosortase system-associated protein, TIGR04073 family [Methylococcales bacterium]|jgi:putative exosortase-associated protein (TIGR04073 family)|nr:exosortase system-associated protein, TIGR04073 family [Methylococcales bacterium]